MSRETARGPCMREGITHTLPRTSPETDEDDAISRIRSRYVTIKNCYISLLLSTRKRHFFTRKIFSNDILS